MNKMQYMLTYVHIIAGKSTGCVKNRYMGYHPYVWHDDARCERIRAEYSGRMQPARRICGNVTGDCVIRDAILLSN